MGPMSLLALALSSACAVPPPPVEPNVYVRQLIGRQRSQEEALSRYAYDVVETREDVDGKGRVVRRRERSYEVYHVKGRPVRRLVARDGRPLPPAERERIDQRARETAEAIQNGKAVSEQPGIRISRILERYDFRAAGSEEVAGRCARAFDFVARPGDFQLERDFVLRKLAGRLWIDVGEDAVVRLEVRNTGGVRIALGLAANVASASLLGEFARLEPGVWLPRLLQGSARGKKLVFFGFHVRERLSFSNYRRFAVDVEEQLSRP
jgi:hypothetical protein